MLLPVLQGSPRRRPSLARNPPTPPPKRAVWELTWRCNLRCSHCLVEGGPNDKEELTPHEALGVADQLADLGIAQVTLTGGEPLFRRDWSQVSRRLAERGVRLILSTNGHLLGEEVLAVLTELKFLRVVMSLDGLPDAHNRVRRGRGRIGSLSSHARVLLSIRRLRQSPVPPSIITTVTEANLGELPALHALLKEEGVRRWMVQLATPQGRLTGNQALLLPPHQLPRLMDFLRVAVRDPHLPPVVHNTIGYLGEEEPLIRPSGRRDPRPFWTGCKCGITSLGIEPDGGVKGCATQVGAPFIVGNLREESLTAIWNDRPRWHWLSPPAEEMNGACSPCGLKRVCGAGCVAMAFATTGDLGNNPYCVRTVRKSASVASQLNETVEQMDFEPLESLR